MKTVKYTTAQGEWNTQKELTYAYDWSYTSFRNIIKYRGGLNTITSLTYKGVMINISYHEILKIK